MTKIFIGIGAAILLGCAVSCKKVSYNDGTAATMNIVNAAPELPSINVYYSETAGGFYNYQQPISPGAYYKWGLGAGNTPVMIFSSLDTVNPIYQDHLQLNPGEIYSLYVLGGDAKSSTLLVKDTIPVQKDSAIGVRFINLSGDSKPFTVNLAENTPSQYEFSGLSFKQPTPFKTYPKNDAMSYNFELRDQASGDLISTFSLNYSYYKNYTLMIYGSADPSSPTPVAIGQINNF